MSPAAPKRPVLELADIVRQHGEPFRQHHILSREQLAVLNAIERCRTALLGGHVDVCRECGAERQSYNSCRNRHCPKCQALAQARWVAQRMTRLLPTHYFHGVFTLPAHLRPVALRNASLIHRMLFEAVSETLLELGRDPQWLGGTLGITCVLHTWTRALEYHPHLHCIVTGGGLSIDESEWSAYHCSGHHRWRHERRADASVVYESCVQRGHEVVCHAFGIGPAPLPVGVDIRVEPTYL